MKKSFLFFLCISYLTVLGLSSVAVAILKPVSLFETDMQNVLASPSLSYLMGADSLGRNLLYRSLFGIYISLMTGIVSVFLAFILGLAVGGIAGYFGGWIDSVLTRFVEILSALPSLVVMAVLYLAIDSAFSLKEQQLVLLILVLALSSWMNVARFSRNLILKEKTELYVESAQAIGSSPVRIFFRHIFPNIFSSLIVFLTLQIPQALMAEGLLSFLGFGVQAPQVSMGSLLQDGWKTMSSFPILLLGPGAILFLTVFSLYYLLDEFRQKIDPQLKWEKFSS